MYHRDPFPLAEPELRWPFEGFRADTVSRDDVRDAYPDNLRLALDKVERPLESVDGDRAAITADHGDAFGECGFYRHVIGCPISSARNVPKAETSATDKGTYESTAPAPDEEAMAAVNNRLEKTRLSLAGVPDRRIKALRVDDEIHASLVAVEEGVLVLEHIGESGERCDFLVTE
jgi:hypothetical protein